MCLCFPSSIQFTVGQGKEGVINFTAGSELLVTKAKNGHLSVVSGLSAAVERQNSSCRRTGEGKRVAMVSNSTIDSLNWTGGLQSPCGYIVKQ